MEAEGFALVGPVVAHARVEHDVAEDDPKAAYTRVGEEGEKQEMGQGRGENGLHGQHADGLQSQEGACRHVVKAGGTIIITSPWAYHSHHHHHPSSSSSSLAQAAWFWLFGRRLTRAWRGDKRGPAVGDGEAPEHVLGELSRQARKMQAKGYGERRSMDESTCARGARSGRREPMG